tara:strand:- start:430 stop:1242 length:813 start_codon:yes stop_codon:yes gene_type:complete
MIDRQEFKEELILRENIRRAIKIVMGRRKAVLNEEEKLRSLIQQMLREGTGVAASAKHNNTGINALEDLLKNTNVLTTLETGYKSLTTSLEQRTSYRNHILNAVKRSLAPEESRKEGGGDLTEDVNIDIGDPADDPDFIDVEEKEGPSGEEIEREEFALTDEDKTGRNRAFTDFKDIEKVILTAFDDLDDPRDIELFEEYLLKNLSLYFDKFEGELQADVAPPPEAEDANPEPGIEAAAELEDAEDAVANIELQETLKFLDIDDIIENLL